YCYNGNSSILCCVDPDSLGRIAFGVDSHRARSASGRYAVHAGTSTKPDQPNLALWLKASGAYGGGSHMAHIGRQHTHDFLSLIGVAPIEPSTSAFDPGYDAITLEGHLQQSHHLISLLKISMACWIVAD